MPHVARFKIDAIKELFQQLRYAPRDTQLRHVAATETLVYEIDPEQNYPLDFVVFRITGYRPETTGESVTCVGGALREDLGNFIQRITWEQELTEEQRGCRALSMEDVAQRLQVSPKTVQRYRRLGLLCHYVMQEDGSKRLACFEDALEQFTKNNARQVRKAAKFSRVDHEAEAIIIEDAINLHENEKLNLNRIVGRLAHKHHRARETVRQILLRYDRSAERPIFASQQTLSQHDQRVVDRALRWGIPAARLAKRFGRTRSAIQRTGHRARRRFLQQLDLSYVDLPTFSLVDPETVILNAPIVTGDLSDVYPDNDALTLIQAQHTSSDHTEETALIGAYNLLKKRCGEAISALSEWPTAQVLDRVETDLRWSDRLKNRLVEHAIPTIVQRLDQNLHAPLITQPPGVILSLLPMAINIVSDLIETLDPGRGQHLEGVAAFELDRTLSRLSSEQPSQKAAARHVPGSLPLPAWRYALTQWSKRFNLRADLVPHLHELEETSRNMIQIRYGLAHCCPQTYRDLAQRFDLTPRGAAQQIRQITIELRRLVRDQSKS